MTEGTRTGVARWLALVLLAISLALAIGCERESSTLPPPEASSPTVELGSAPAPKSIGSARRTPFQPPALFPASRSPSDYVGSGSCAPCHGEVYSVWKRSQHGRAIRPASVESVLGNFAGPELVQPDGTVGFKQEGDRFTMTIRTSMGLERHDVTLVLGSGRQHQVYFTKGVDGRYRMLPVIWKTRGQAWIWSSPYVGGSLVPRSPNHWKWDDLVSLPCLNCHTSQVTYRATADGSGPIAEWVEMPINCESCHGPGRRHVERKDQGKPDDSFWNLQAIGQDRELRVCGECHSSRGDFATRTDERGWPDFLVGNLAFPGFRADGTQLGTTYQYTGHILSECFKQGALKCKSCHDPHSGAARTLAGESAEGDRSDGQCTVCHRNLLDGDAARRHSHHPASTRCVDCHMARSWIYDDPELEHANADHSIPIPRPREALQFGTTDPCLACHSSRDSKWSLGVLEAWGQYEATRIRPWVRTVYEARRLTPGGTRRAIELLADQAVGDYLRESTISLLGRYTATPEIVAALRPFASHPDPRLRGAALDALARLDDPARALAWRRLGTSDSDAYVRLTLLRAEKDPASFDDATLRRLARDALQARQRPSAVELSHLALTYMSRGDVDEALELAEMAIRYASPGEARKPHLAILPQVIRKLKGEQAKASQSPR